MSDLICVCPLPAVIPDISNQDCSESFGSVGKIGFQKIKQSFTDIQDLTEWETAITATDNTKIQVTPLLDSQEFPASTPITVGGDDNTTFDGTPRIVGESHVAVKYTLRDLPISIYKELKELECYAASKTLGVYLLGTDFCISDENDSAIKIGNMFLSSPLLGGRTETNNYELTIMFPAKFWQKAKFNKLVFDPMDLIN
jgi:hypothetical protein